jgi:hypothetical protein|tara:strand:- start:138 stop:593 length:456 start_codon:yes stop_codon:yes gene_type:complete
MAVDAAAAGKVIVNVPAVLVLLDEKSKIQTDLSLFVSLYIIAPIAVIVAVVKLRSEKSANPVVPLVVGSILVRADPPVAYDPLEATSPVVVKAVVVAPNVAVVLLFPPPPSAYKANLKLLPPEALKLWVACRTSLLNAVHIACAIAISQTP